MLMQHHQYGVKDVPDDHKVKFMYNGWYVLSNKEMKELVKEAEEDCGCNKMLPEPKVEPKKRGRPFKAKV
jgi:hypothetical protein